MIFSRFVVRAATAGLLSLPVLALAQVRVGTWNVTNYSSTANAVRQNAFKTALYGEFQGRTFAPDIFVAQEILNDAGRISFLNLMNTAPGSPGDWASSPFVNNGDTSNSLFYRTTRFEFVAQKEINVSVPNDFTTPPRDPMRYDVRFKGYQNSANAPILSVYSDHFKAGDTSTDQARRIPSANAIRADAAALPVGQSFLLGGDFNIQNSTQTAYQNMVGSQSNNNGRFFDPINSPGRWNANADFRFIHTQDQKGPGGMDDRHDQILINDDLRNGTGVEYIGSATLAYSTTTWNDPNHSYRAWGNDGTSFDEQLTTIGNSFVGPTIAQSLIDTLDGQQGGHLPIFLDLKTAAEIGASTSLLDFGDVILGSSQSRSLSLFNSVDASIYGVNGIQSFTYTLGADGGFSAPLGPFMDLAGGGFNAHNIVLDTSMPGMRIGSLTVVDVSGITRTIGLRANVTAVPEPATLAALGLGLAAFLRRRKRA